jgi:hypothetical protein
MTCAGWKILAVDGSTSNGFGDKHRIVFGVADDASLVPKPHAGRPKQMEMNGPWTRRNRRGRGVYDTGRICVVKRRNAVAAAAADYWD